MARANINRMIEKTINVTEAIFIN